MSVNFMWSMPKSGKCLKHGTSSDIKVLEKFFGALPKTFTHDDCASLHAMAAVKGNDSIYAEIADNFY